MKYFLIIILSFLTITTGNAQNKKNQKSKKSEKTQVQETQQQKTASGVIYKDIVTGTGREATENVMVLIDVVQWVYNSDENVFAEWTDKDSAVQKLADTKQEGQPLKFKIGDGFMHPLLEEGMLGMKVGGQRKLVIPSEVINDSSFTAKGLRFDISLIDIKDPVVIKQWEYKSEDVKTTPSGLKYVIISKGNGKKAESGKTVVVHYSGFLNDGKMFDSSVERGETFEFPLGQGKVIKGWDEGIALLQVGDKAKLIIPSELAYGSRDMGTIPPNSELIFDVELIDVK